MRRLIPAIALPILLCGLFSCHKEKKVDHVDGLDPLKMATMTSHNVETLISDSGIVQFRMITPLWLVYEELDTPVWRFPKGLYLERFGPARKVIASVAADSARYFKNMRLWRLDGHVEIRKIPGDLFQTSQLFWNERYRRVYSDSFVHIETPTHVLEGIGFESDDNLSDYSLRTPTGIFPVHQDAFGNRTAVASEESASERPETASVSANPEIQSAEAKPVIQSLPAKK